MAVIFQIGLVTLLMIVVSEQQEYRIKAVKKLPSIKYESAPTENLLDYELVNPGAKVKWNRDDKRTDPTVSFVVDTEWKDDSSKLSPRSETAESCNGRPGIEISSQCKKQSGAFCCAAPNERPRLFCIKRMYIDFIQNRGDPYMRVEAKFYDSKNNKISIELDMFRPPTEKDDEEHAKRNKVPHIGSPIPEESLKNSPLVSGIIGESGNQHFIGDISWMENALPRAKFMGSKKEGSIKTDCINHYSTGPVLLDDEPYGMIFDLGGFEVNGEYFEN